MKKFALGFYAGAASIMSTVILSMSSSGFLQAAVGGLLWPYTILKIVALVFFNAELP